MRLDIETMKAIDFAEVMEAGGNASGDRDRIATSKRPHLSPLTKELLIVLAQIETDGADTGISKRELAVRLACCLKTIDRGLAHLRRTGMIVSRVRLDKTGAQLSSQHLVTPAAREFFPELMRAVSPA